MKSNPLQAKNKISGKIIVSAKRRKTSALNTK